MLHRAFESLTSTQREAVEHVDGPLLILAGPGSGKTRVITHRIAYLLHQGVSARQILALTFTNKAADEMRARLESLAPGQPVWVSTFHRFCSRLLRQYAGQVGLAENFTIQDTGDSLQVVRRAAEEASVDLTHFTPERIAAAISWAKNNLITAEQYVPRPGHALGSIVAKVYPRYQALMLRSNGVDFDDLLLHVATLLRESSETRATLDDRYRQILVDEYQDTNLAQYSIVRALSIDHANLTVTGDPDQSIYGWRGANLSNILDFENDFPQVRVVKLEQNYRSTKRICRVADALIANNTRRKAKGLFTDNDEGARVGLTAYATQRHEAESIAARIAADVRSGQRRPRDFAIFYRVNALSRSLEFAMREYGVPYQMVNGVEFYQRKEIKDVLAYLHLLNNPRNDVSLLRVINTPPRGIGRTTVARIAEHASRYGLTLLDAARESGLIESLNKRAAVNVARVVAMFDRLSLVASAPVEEILGHVLTESGYREFLSASDDVDDQERLANIEELLTAARQFDEQNPGENHLEEFLEQASLVNDTDAWETEGDSVTLMTLHASKGLEFPVVHVIALEHGLMPHERSSKEIDQLEEERRLLFVGITRAKEELQLSCATYREFRGQRRLTIPSGFLMELPRDEMDVVETGRVDRPAPVASTEYVCDEATESLPRGTAAATSSASRLMTAAELHGSARDTAIHEPTAAGQSTAAVEEFYQGMLVKHAEYGLGKVVALSGSGSRRTVTVAFASAAGQQKFVLSHSGLKPVR